MKSMAPGFYTLSTAKGSASYDVGKYTQKLEELYEELKNLDPKYRKEKEAETKGKYGILFERLSKEGKKLAKQRRETAQAQIDIENEKAQADVAAKCAQIKQQYDADHNAWQDEYNRLKAEYEAAYKKWETETNAIKAQAEQWQEQGRCPHDGGTLKGLFKKKCTECRKRPSEPISMAAAPAIPNYPDEPQMPQMPTYTPLKPKKETVFPDDVVATAKGEHAIVTLGGIDWRVLAIENNKVLLISEEIIEKGAYGADQEGLTWEKCSLRAYLNGKFYNKLGAAKSAIIETSNSNPDNPWTDATGGNTTTDKIFLLSLDEVCRYFGNSGDLTNKRRKSNLGTQDSHGLYISDGFNKERIANYGSEGATPWWLRSPGECAYRLHKNSNGTAYMSKESSSTCAAFVSKEGFIGVGGGYGYGGGGDSGHGYIKPHDYVGIRPAMWIEL
jgi:hypothetical protein